MNTTTPKLQGLGCVAGPDNALFRCQPGTQYTLCAAAMLPVLEECCPVLLTDNALQNMADGIEVQIDEA